ncbi:MAG TPA: histidine kinase, partial [Thermoanaerobaculia bacterium]|nr:histidine kinase [Thermoanaerobaculia bacterium]
MPRRRLSIRWWLAGLVLGVALPLTLLLTLLFVEQTRRHAVEAQQSALATARTMASRLRALHGDSLRLLGGMAARPAIRDFDGARCDSLFALVDFFPQYLDLALFDAHGALVCSGTPTPTDEPIATIARAWLSQELQSGQLHPHVPIIRSIRDHWVSVVAQPVTGSFRGTLAIIALPEIVGRDALPPGAVVTILDDRGTIVARTHDPERWTGRNVRRSALTEIVLREKEGVTQARGVDGVFRQYGFATIPEIKWSIYVGVPTTEVMAAERIAFARGLLGGSVIVLVLATAALIVSRAIGRPLDALARAAASVSRGAYGRVNVAGPREIAELAAGFNEMVENRSRAEEEMHEKEQALKALSDNLLVAQEQERTRIAREIHDDLGQAVTALKMDVLGLMEKMQDRDSPVRARVLQTLDALVTSVQRIASELRPSILDDLGLVAAVESEARMFEERTGIECELSLPDDVDVDSTRATAMYRIIQEALTNVARHSNATRVELRVRPRENEVWIEIRDDGRGISAQEVGSARSLGLIGIRER